MKKTLAAGAVFGVLLLPAAPASAVNDDKIFPAVCNGQAVTVTAPGAAFYVNGQKYLLMTLDGTFTPAGETEAQSFNKTYGKRTGKTGPSITCTGGGTDAEGTFSFTAVGVLAK